MRIRYNLLLAVLLTFPVFLTAQIEDADIIFRELHTLEGTWFIPQDRGDRLEVWWFENDSTLAGKGLRIKAETLDTVLLENMRIELRGETVVYWAAVRGQNENKPVPFELTLADTEGYLFENPEHDNPKKIRYRLLGNRELQVTTEGRRGARTVTEEFVYEREFNPAGVEFRVRLGVNYFQLSSTGYLTPPPAPVFSGRPGWELGTQFAFRGRGGFITVNVEAGLIGKFSHVKSAFTVFQDTTFIDYKRDVTYNQTWFVVAAIPELTLWRDGPLSIMAGPYYGRLLFNSTKGLELPGGDNKLFDANNDFKKSDIGIIGGFQCRLNFGKKDLGGRLGLRASISLGNLDNLYTKRPTNADPDLYNGQIGLRGISLYYSLNLLNL